MGQKIETFTADEQRLINLVKTEGQYANTPGDLIRLLADQRKGAGSTPKLNQMLNAKPGGDVVMGLTEAIANAWVDARKAAGHLGQVNGEALDVLKRITAEEIKTEMKSRADRMQFKSGNLSIDISEAVTRLAAAGTGDVQNPNEHQSQVTRQGSQGRGTQIT